MWTSDNRPLLPAGGRQSVARRRLSALCLVSNVARFTKILFRPSWTYLLPCWPPQVSYSHVTVSNPSIDTQRQSLLTWCSSLCPSGTGVYCDHTVHVSGNLSLWLDSRMFWTPWHQSTSTYSQPSFANSTRKRGVVWMCKLGVISQERLKIEVKLLLSAKEKSYMPRRLAQQRMTLRDLEWPFHVVHTKINIIRIARYLCGSWPSYSLTLLTWYFIRGLCMWQIFNCITLCLTRQAVYRPTL